MFLDAGGDGEDVGVEDDVLGREADVIDQHPVGTLADLDLALIGIGLADIIEGHDHHGGTVTATDLRLLPEAFLAFLERDGIDHRLALDALEPRLDDVPLRGIDHDRHARDVRLRGDQVQEAHHGLL